MDWAVLASVPPGFWSVGVSTRSVQPGGATGRLAVLSAPLLSSLGSEVCPPGPTRPGGRGQGPPALTGGFGSGPGCRSAWGGRRAPGRGGGQPSPAGLSLQGREEALLQAACASSCRTSVQFLSLGSPSCLVPPHSCSYPFLVVVGAPAPAAASCRRWGCRVHPCPALAPADHWALVSPTHPHVGPLAAGCPPSVHSHACLVFHLRGPRS